MYKNPKIWARSIPILITMGTHVQDRFRGFGCPNPAQFLLLTYYIYIYFLRDHASQCLSKIKRANKQDAQRYKHAKQDYQPTIRRRDQVQKSKNMGQKYSNIDNEGETRVGPVPRFRLPKPVPIFVAHLLYIYFLPDHASRCRSKIKRVNKQDAQWYKHAKQDYPSTIRRRVHVKKSKNLGQKHSNTDSDGETREEPVPWFRLPKAVPIFIAHLLYIYFLHDHASQCLFKIK